MRQLSDAEIEAVQQAKAAEIEARWHDVLEMTRVAYDERDSYGAPLVILG